MLGNIIHKKHFGTVGLDGETFVGTDAALRGHERRIGHDDIKIIVPSALIG